MPDSLGPALADLSYIAAAAVMLYVAYWAFAIRRALIGRIYRNHALWLGVFGITLLLVLESSLLPSSDNPFISALETTFTSPLLPSLVAFAFIDSTIPVARRSDPLLRSILHWEKARIVMWSVLTFFTGLIIYENVVDVSFASNFASNFWILGPVLLSVMFPVVIPGAPALLIGARRSRDPLLRESLKWFGVSLLFLQLGILLVGVVEIVILGLSNYYMNFSYGAVPWSVVIVFFGYALYRSARSLAPLNRLPPIEPEMIPPAKEATS